MEKLELKHLAPYLPYGLKGITQNRLTIMCGIKTNVQLPIIWEEIESKSKFKGQAAPYHNEHYTSKGGFKPILRPLSDLAKEVELNGVVVIPMELLNGLIMWESEWYKDVENQSYTYGIMIAL